MTDLQGPKDIDRGHGYATASHYIWGQEVKYYSYLYTRALAVDIWFSVFASDPMSSEAGLKYREIVLARGGDRDEWTGLVELLGRVPTAQAYLRDLRSV